MIESPSGLSFTPKEQLRTSLFHPVPGHQSYWAFNMLTHGVVNRINGAGGVTRPSLNQVAAEGQQLRALECLTKITVPQYGLKVGIPL